MKMKKLKEYFKRHKVWIKMFLSGLVSCAFASFLLGLLSMALSSSTGNSQEYVPFNDLKEVKIKNVTYLDNNSKAYVEGIADGNRKIHIDVYDGKIPSNFKNTNTAVVFETADKDLYLNKESYDEENPKTTDKDNHKYLKSYVIFSAILSIVLSAFLATISNKITTTPLK